MIDFNEIHKKPYHFTLERVDPYDENVPEAIIPADKNLYFLPEEMLELRRFYKTYGRDVPFEELEDFAPDSYDEDWWAMLDYLYSCTSIDMMVAEAAAYPDPVLNKDGRLATLMRDLPYNLDDYWIIPPEELINNVLDDNFTDWMSLANKLDLDNALLDAEAELFE